MSMTNPNPAVQANAELAREAVLAVIIIKSDYVEFGTRFVIKSDGGGSIVLTANHVIEEMVPGDRLYIRRML